MRIWAQATVVWCMVVISATLIGCGEPEGANRNVGDGAENAAADTRPDTDAAVSLRNESSDGAAGDSAARASNISVTVASRDDYDRLIERHQGKVVVVDFWATWCGPCVQQFPHTVELSKKHDPNEMAVISVSMDEPEDRTKVLAFLRRAGAAPDNLISKYGVSQEGFETFEIADGAIPHYKLYDRTGKLRYEANSNQDIDARVEQLLNEQ